ncbi:hypothetical protein [Bradyrhizobium lablabi]|uniref:Uncharacterized protein n=1 Tax=Bradyrhizobium lablabi TaxID=722472 RepID=A0A1H5JIH3_9BRAD|nr:hypothetical protein [Bradyrhizobium lablabi]SEE52249.1 hypothetical protein SAMN05444171_7842 [Bradyrhizobium lablabi]
MTKVVGIRGEPIAVPGEVNPEVVKLAGDILEMAKSGNINALFAVLTHSDETVSSLHHGIVTLRVIGAVTHELHNMCAGKD